MAIIKCSECGKEYSDKANKCPNCACPTKYSQENKIESKEESDSQKEKEAKSEVSNTNEKKNHTGLIVTIIVIVVLVIVGVVISSMSRIEGLQIVESKGTISKLGSMEWEGDIVNNGYSRADNVNIIITCYSKSRERTGLAYTKLKYIEPGEKIHFKATGLGDYDKRNESDCGYEIKLGNIEIKDLQ